MQEKGKEGIYMLGFLSRMFSACIILFFVVTREWNKANNSSCSLLGWDAEGNGWRQRRVEKISATWQVAKMSRIYYLW